MSIIPFPVTPMRAFLVDFRAAPDEGWIGEYVGLADYDGPARTQFGPLRYVVEALLQRDVRCGLPIIAPREAVQTAMTGPSPLRPAKVRCRLTDREKYDAALARQLGQLRDRLVEQAFAAFWPDDTPGGHAA